MRGGKSISRGTWNHKPTSQTHGLHMALENVFKPYLGSSLQLLVFLKVLPLFLLPGTKNISPNYAPYQRMSLNLNPKLCPPSCQCSPQNLMPTPLTLTRNTKPCYRKSEARLNVYGITMAGHLPSPVLGRSSGSRSTTGNATTIETALAEHTHTQHYPLSQPCSRLANLKRFNTEVWQWQMTTNSRAWPSDQTASALNDANMKVHPSLNWGTWTGEKGSRQNVNTYQGSGSLKNSFPLLFHLPICLQERGWS